MHAAGWNGRCTSCDRMPAIGAFAVEFSWMMICTQLSGMSDLLLTNAYRQWRCFAGGKVKAFGESADKLARDYKKSASIRSSRAGSLGIQSTFKHYQTIFN